MTDGPLAGEPSSIASLPRLKLERSRVGERAIIRDNRSRYMRPHHR